jgi:hypothetical protein
MIARHAGPYPTRQYLHPVMDATAFLGLQPTEDPARWRLPVVAGISAGGGFLFGGCGLGAAVVALESFTGRPTAWMGHRAVPLVRAA